MTTAERILAVCAKRRLRPAIGRSGKLALVGPASAVTPQLVAAVRAFKAEVLFLAGLAEVAPAPPSSGTAPTVAPTVPDDLPGILWYRVGAVVLSALPRTPVEYVGTSGKTTAATVRPTVPAGADAWQVVAGGDWLPLSELPAQWMPFLQRQRPGPMDPRPAPKAGRDVPADAIRDDHEGGDE